MRAIKNPLPTRWPDGDAAMFASRYGARVTVTVAGDQKVDISTYTRLPGDETGGQR
jgi:hypothetical protein